jgi:YD repeat-containing protein
VDYAEGRHQQRDGTHRTGPAAVNRPFGAPPYFTPFSLWSHTHDATGNLTEAVDAQAAVTRYTYDGAGPLTIETSPAGVVRYR